MNSNIKFSSVYAKIYYKKKIFKNLNALKESISNMSLIRQFQLLIQIFFNVVYMHQNLLLTHLTYFIKLSLTLYANICEIQFYGPHSFYNAQYTEEEQTLTLTQFKLIECCNQKIKETHWVETIMKCVCCFTFFSLYIQFKN